MKRFSIRTLLGLVTVAAVIAWQFGSGYQRVFYEDSPQHGVLEVFSAQEKGKHLVRIRFSPAGGTREEVHESGVLVLPSPVKRLSFQSVHDVPTGGWFVCDENDQRLVIVIQPQPVSPTIPQLWHPGERVGWMRGMWAKFYREAKVRHPGLPYKWLPQEMELLGS